MDKKYISKVSNILEELFPNYIITLIDETKKQRQKVILFRSLDENLDEIIEYNSGDLPAHKYGVYFTPNGWFRLNEPLKRTEMTARAINSFILDIDTDEKENVLEKIKNFWLQPTLIVETNHGYHVYRVLKEPYKIKDNEDRNLFKTIQQYLITKLGGDPQVKDLARVLRIPGFKYWKDNKGEIIIKILELNEKNKYDIKLFQQIIEDEEMLDISKDDLISGILSNLDGDGQRDVYDFVEKVNELNAAEVLEKLFPQYTVKGTTIYENGKRTDGYKYNQQENYLNNFSPNHPERPRGKAYHIIKKYCNGDFKKIVEIVKDEFGIEFNNSEKYKFYKKVVIDIEQETELIPENYEQLLINLINGDCRSLKDITIEQEGFNYIFSFESCEIYVEPLTKRKDVQPIRLLNGILFPIMKLPDSGYAFLLLQKSKRRVKKRVVKISSLDRSMNLRKELMEYGLIIENNDRIFTSFMRIIYNLPLLDEYEIISGKGIHILKNGNKVVINNTDELAFDFENKYLILISLKNNLANIEYHIAEKKQISIQDAYKIALNIYSDEIITTLFSALIIAYNQNFFKSIGRKNRITFGAGITQTGKTTVFKTILDLSGFYATIAAGSTQHSKLVAATFKGPLWLSEYRNSDNKKEEQNSEFLRNVYDRATITKGLTTLRVVEYPMQAKIFIDGESAYKDPATVNRTFFLLFSNSKKKKDGLEAINELQDKSIHQALLQHSFEKEFVLDMYKAVIKAVNLKDYDDRAKEMYLDLLVVAKMFFGDEAVKNILKAIKFDRQYKDNNPFIDKIGNILIKFMTPNWIAKGAFIELMGDRIIIRNGLDFLRTNEAGLFTQYMMEKFVDDEYDVFSYDVMVPYDDLIRIDKLADLMIKILRHNLSLPRDKKFINFTNEKKGLEFIRKLDGKSLELQKKFGNTTIYVNLFELYKEELNLHDVALEIINSEANSDIKDSI